jgi:hypothetical protein
MKTLLLLMTLASSTSVFAAQDEACQIDVFVKLKYSVLSTWVKAERSELNGVECLVRAYDLAEKNDKINIKINDKYLALAGNLKIRK